MRCFICGPSSGVPFFNADAFDRAELWLLTSFDTVHNPAKHREEEMHVTLRTCKHGSLIVDKNYTPAQAANHCRHALKWDIEKLTASDVIALLPGWEQFPYPSHLAALASMMGVARMVIPDHVVDTDPALLLPNDGEDDDFTNDPADILPISPNAGRAA